MVKIIWDLKVIVGVLEQQVLVLFKNGSALIEVKNVASQGLTSQLNRYLNMGYGTNIIYVRLGTKVSSALKASAYVIKYLPW